MTTLLIGAVLIDPVPVVQGPYGIKKDAVMALNSDAAVFRYGEKLKLGSNACSTPPTAKSGGAMERSLLPVGVT